jgi:hypothetical protein
MSNNWLGFHEGPRPTDKLSEHFDWSEADCNHCGRLPKDLQAVRNQAALLEKVRTILGEPIRVHSWFRCPTYNASLPGHAPNSQHLAGRATDIGTKHLSPRQAQAKLRPYWAGNRLKPPIAALGKFLRGFGRYAGFTHVDNRPGEPSTWSL